MTDLKDVLENPTHDDHFEPWFEEIADELLNRTAFVIGGKRHRLLEIEFYYQDKGHEDPFAHGDEMQKTHNRWYFHRSGGEYRGGSFKGLDITFGAQGTHGGILIRTIEDEDGNQVNGCSLCVDKMLEITAQDSVADLDGEVDERDVWDTDSPLYLETTSDLEEREIYPTARVGLTLKRMYEFPEMPAYLMRPLRFLTDPTISKGKLYTVASLIEKGLDDDAIRDITGTTRASITRARTAIDDGKTQESFKPWKGKKLKTADLHTLYGVYLNVYGEE